MNERTAFIALGSNLGDSISILSQASRALEPFSTRPVRRSSLWKSTPVDCPPDSPDFINAVIEIFPDLHETAESLLSRLQTIEKEFGRLPKKILNEARPLDLDLIDFARERRESVSLVLPHPRAHLRRFVLEPLAELTPDLLLPGQKKTVRELLATLRTDESLQKITAVF